MEIIIQPENENLQLESSCVIDGCGFDGCGIDI